MMRRDGGLLRWSGWLRPEDWIESVAGIVMQGSVADSVALAVDAGGCIEFDAGLPCLEACANEEAVGDLGCTLFSCG